MAQYYSTDEEGDDSPVYYLNCPFEEKDDAKALGAKFDGSSKRWFVPPRLYSEISCFNRWRPSNRLYLNCPYEEKDDAKKAGAKWDPIVKSWYVTKPTNKVKRWLYVEEDEEDQEDDDPSMVPSAALSSNASSKNNNNKRSKTKKPAVRKSLAPSSSSSSKSSPPKKRGNAQDAATLRISDAMTVGQLQEECRTRGISGYSGKNKDYLLDQLGVGSIWQTMSMKNKKEKDEEKKKATKAKPKTKKDDTPAKKETKNTKAAKATPTTTTKKAGGGGSKAKATPKETKAAAKSKPPSKTKSIDWNSLPKVSTSLTLAQLMHELMHRQPSTKGTSGKPKAWFLERLGENSIWSTSPEACSSKALTNAAKVTSSLTVAQLTHELMSREGTTTKGLSSKSKGELLKLAGEGSIWTTAPPADHNDGAKKPSAAAAGSKKRPPTASSSVSAMANKATTKPPSKVHDDDNNNNSTSVFVSTTVIAGEEEENREERVLKEVKQDSNILLCVEMKAGTKAGGGVVKKELKKKAGVVKEVMDQSKAEGIIASSTKQHYNTETSPKRSQHGIPLVHSGLTVAELKKELKTRQPNLKGYSNKKKEWFLAQLPLHTEMQSSDEYKAQQHVAKPGQLALSSSHSCPTKEQSISTTALVVPVTTGHKKGGDQQKLKLEQRNGTMVKKNERGIPVVHEGMTVTQLREELKTRRPRLTGYSNKKKEWFLDRLPLNSELHSSAEYKSEQEAKVVVAAAPVQDSDKKSGSGPCCFGSSSSRAMEVAESKQEKVQKEGAEEDNSENRSYHLDEVSEDEDSSSDEILSAVSLDEVVGLYGDLKDYYLEYGGFLFDLGKEDEIYRPEEFSEEDVSLSFDESMSVISEGERIHCGGAMVEAESDNEEENDFVEQETENTGFPENISNPSAANKDEERKLEFTVWKKDIYRSLESTEVEMEFDSSFATLKEANQRVEYVHIQKQR